MKRTWRWFGPGDSVSINDMLQAGVEGVVTSLHHIPSGDLWTIEDIKTRQREIEQRPDGSKTGLTWDIVESLPVSEDIKRQSADWLSHIENYKQSILNLAACGIEVICYNFMPVLDWTRTDLNYRLPNGAQCMRFDLVDFATFDIHILQRQNAAADFPHPVVVQAKSNFEAMNQSARDTLATNIICGLPGASGGYTLVKLAEQLELYSNITEADLRRHHIEFISAVISTAERAGVRLACHPDDPPFPLLGLPRVMSTEADYKYLTEAVDSPANGITLCSGSLGVVAENDLPGMMERLGDKVHFLHLRNIARDNNDYLNTNKTSFYESAHLEGVTDMVALIKAVLSEEARRSKAGHKNSSIAFRPDHGQQILSDLNNDTQPGYPAVGRLKGLAELRGIIAALRSECFNE